MWDLSSPTRDRTRVPCIGRRILYHWTTREVPRCIFDGLFGYLHHLLLAALPTIHPEPCVSLSSSRRPCPPSPSPHVHSLSPHPASGSHPVWPVIWPSSPTWSPCSSLSLFECFSCHCSLSFETTVLVILFPYAHTSDGSPLPTEEKNWVSDRYSGLFILYPLPFTLLSSHTGLPALMPSSSFLTEVSVASPVKWVS